MKSIVPVMCATQNCDSKGLVKEIGLVHLGNNVYQGGDLICGNCGNVMLRADAIDAPRQGA